MVAEGCTFRLGTGFVFPALQALCALGMLGIRDSIYLAHHLQGFPVVPVFDDPAPGDAVHTHPTHLDPSSGRRDAHDLAPMGAAGDPSGTTMSPSATCFSTVKLMSGKAEWYARTICLMSSGPRLSSGSPGAWLR